MKQLIDTCVVSLDTEAKNDTDIKVITPECHNDLITHPLMDLKIDNEKYVECFDKQIKELERNRQ